ncbi:hypothetical protein KHS38_15310 [Mucilaginibacter sp. Bleaf8]|uniref:hypothetical protein n=1 Tax=Mucilaginibacter sp. Bleaf8 TaxID=2834430 RepID=UPI001BCD617F|nr:hypothetical protein [Mucilaginibacter sp. Bleaf8]MBS7565776.1 hypothetical protein [Mucilaginibacter sp. Bleaf8]
MTKYWVTAKTKTWNKAQQQQNHIMEVDYQIVLKKAKQLLAPDKPLFFERNFKQHGTIQELAAMHAFLSPCFYFRLDCDGAYNYQIEYAFYQCKHEKAIKVRLQCFAGNLQVTEVALQPDFATFYKNVQHYQGNKFFYTLTA